MKESPVITKIEAIHYSHTLNEVGRDYNTFNMVYEPRRNIQTIGIFSENSY